MQVAADIRARVTAKINECVAKINSHHGIVMPKITVAYDINSARLGGEARPSQMLLRFNPAYLNAHTDHYIAQTVPHEVAHLGVRAVHGASHYTVRSRTGRVKMKRDIHGDDWQAMMRLLGCPADRCHNYALPQGAVVGKPKAKYNYTCSVCQAIVVVGPKIHDAMQAGQRRWHRGCSSGRLVFAVAAGRVSYTQARQQGATPAPTPVAPVKVKPTPSSPKKVGTKLDQCFNWYCHYKAQPEFAGSLRQVCIAVFVQEVGMSAAGASTYYNTCQKMYAA